MSLREFHGLDQGISNIVFLSGKKSQILPDGIYQNYPCLGHGQVVHEEWCCMCHIGYKLCLVSFSVLLWFPLMHWVLEHCSHLHFLQTQCAKDAVWDCSRHLYWSATSAAQPLPHHALGKEAIWKNCV